MPAITVHVRHDSCNIKVSKLCESKRQQPNYENKMLILHRSFWPSSFDKTTKTKHSSLTNDKTPLPHSHYQQTYCEKYFRNISHLKFSILALHFYFFFYYLKRYVKKVFSYLVDYVPTKKISFEHHPK